MDKVKDAKTKKAAGKKKPKNNARNLVPNSERTPSELRAITQKGGVASGKARREKRDRQEQVLMILDLAVKNPEIMEKLDKLGVEGGKRTIETAMDVSVINRVLETGDPTAYKAIKEEAYGKVRDKTDGGFSLNLSIDSAHFGGEYVVDSEVSDE
ncbi:hypothetical protein IKF88_02460 [Candidatus Saccharibacteria bacterium]|nr:hypothetical protein [Candidatus Saccharibacteria bacterium]